ncbi:hypothetical protein Poly59_55420 [Rubripirellula reticaptiva]|uniref:Uncharacterized protein n=1 Tax=Rubripirellula reticaptiva TaxID=2528013 RepID=A0A5C6EH55_9BACT|nr:hypothetical protein Poly59_55420 [Rubripirellula reticaptiva]
MNFHAGEQAIDVVGLRRITAKQSVIAKDPNIAELRYCFVRRLRHVLGIGQTLRDAGIEQLGKFVIVEPKQLAIETGLLEFADFDGQQVPIPFGVLAGSVIGDPICLDRFGFKVRCDVNGHFGQT